MSTQTFFYLRVDFISPISDNKKKESMSKSIEVCVYGLLAVLFIIILFNYWTFNAGMDVLLIIGLVSTVVMGVKTLKKV